MSITAETAKEHAKDPAVLCCRAEGGITIQAANLEDPAIFDDLVDSGLLKLDGTLTIEQVLGAKLVKTCDSLTPLTADLVEGAKAPAAEEAPAEEAKEEVKEEAPAVTANPTASVQKVGGVLKIHIGEGKDIDIEMPMGFNNGVAVAEVPAEVELPAGVVSGATPTKELEPKVVRSVTRKHYKITEVKRGPETKIEGTTLYIREGIEEEAVASQELVHQLKIDIITPDQYHTYSNTIMDVQPIATKEGEDEIGTGTTRVLDGVIMMVTGTDDNGVQIGEFGSSEGYLDENIMWGRPGAPDKGEIFIKTEVIIKEGTNMERPGPLAAHSATDVITQEIHDFFYDNDFLLTRSSYLIECLCIYYKAFVFYFLQSFTDFLCDNIKCCMCSHRSTTFHVCLSLNYDITFDENLTLIWASRTSPHNVFVHISL